MYPDTKSNFINCDNPPNQAESAKMQAQCATQAGIGREYTLSEQAEKAGARYSEEANKNYQAAEFFRSHPEFEQFIKLVRSGAIQF